MCQSGVALLADSYSSLAHTLPSLLPLAPSWLLRLLMPWLWLWPKTLLWTNAPNLGAASAGLAISRLVLGSCACALAGWLLCLCLD